MKAWETGSIIGIVIGILYSLLTPQFLMKKFGSGIISNLVPIVSYAIIGFIIGAIVGFIIGKVNGRKKK